MKLLAILILLVWAIVLTIRISSLEWKKKPSKHEKKGLKITSNHWNYIQGICQKHKKAIPCPICVKENEIRIALAEEEGFTENALDFCDNLR